MLVSGIRPLGTVGVAAAGSAVAALTVLAAAPSGLSSLSAATSTYALTPWAWAFRWYEVSLAGAGLALLLAFVVAEGRRATGPAIALALFVGGRAFIGWINEDAPGSAATLRGDLHWALGILSFVSTVVAMLLTSRLLRRAGLPRLGTYSGILGSIAATYVLLLLGASRGQTISGFFGLFERGYYVATIIWLFSMTITCVIAGPHLALSAAPRGRHRSWARVLSWFLGAAAAAVTAVAIACLCIVGAVVAQGRAAPAGAAQYVALGSSFAAGPGVGTQAVASPDLCDRSGSNYAHLVAHSSGLDLTDMTCSGAVSRDVLDGGQFFQGPQLAAVRSPTRVVTITVGGNDVYYLGNLWAWSCKAQPAAVPPLYRAAGACVVHSQTQVDAAFAVLPERMARIVRTAQRTAPDARVLLVDYATVLPPSGTCAALPITAKEADRARATAERLRMITQAVASSTGATLVDAAALTAGHDICSRAPWVSGFAFDGSPLSHSTLPYHPTAAAMRAIASAISKAVN